MIFVTVGTHEQQFDRLLKYIDWLKEKEKEMRAAGNRFYYGPIPPGVGITDFP